jgi:raffinose/stachyose/melibiose transport system permease protein
MHKKLHNGLIFCLFVVPSLAFVMFATNIPFVMNLFYSFFKWNGISRSMKFVGFSNFKVALKAGSTFLASASFTLRFALFYVVFVNILALAVAVGLQKESAVSNLGRAFYYVPYIISLTAISLIWKFILGPGFDSLYEMTNASFFSWSWLGDPKLAFFVVLIMSIWQNVGFYMVNYIAGLTTIPTDLEEAAIIDGAGPFQRFFRVTFPLLMPAVTICLLTSLTFAFKLFDIIMVFTKGGPANSTITVAYDIYREAFVYNNYGMATAKSLIFVIFVLMVTAVQLKFTKSKEIEA